MLGVIDTFRRRRERVDVLLARAQRIWPGAGADVAYEDLSQASALVEPGERERFFDGRSLLRNALAARTGRLPRDLRIASGANGRLFLLDDDDAPSFSIAHSGRWIAIAICDEMPIGVSVGEIGGRPALESVVRALVPPEAVAELNQHDAERRAEATLRWWVSLEASAKACGATLEGARECLRAAPPRVLRPAGDVLVGLATRSARPPQIRCRLLDGPEPLVAANPAA